MTHIPPLTTSSISSGLHHSGELHHMEPQQVMATRELFWQNVIREILTSLSMMCALRPPEPEQHADDEVNEPSDNGEGSTQLPAAPVKSEVVPNAFEAEFFDGRFAIITRRGERIPIADVFPLFACGIDTPRERVLSLALECTVFQIRTPAGEVYTLPLHEIGSFQALTPELMRRLSQLARKQQEAGQKDVQQPFGFAAFTSIARETPPPMSDPEGNPAED